MPLSRACGLYKIHHTLHIWIVSACLNPLVFRSFLQVTACCNLRDMKRCSLFFLAFVTTLLLAAVSGSFKDGRETLYKGGDDRDAMIAIREKRGGVSPGTLNRWRNTMAKARAEQAKLGQNVAGMTIP